MYLHDLYENKGLKSIEKKILEKHKEFELDDSESIEKTLTIKEYQLG